MNGREALHARLSELGRAPDTAFPLAEAALVLAALDRPRVALARYREHLDALHAEAGEALADLEDIAEAAAALARMMADRHGYRGDELSYDDMQNANLMRVIDRRRGLPVALGVLYLHAARGGGLEAAGLNLPGHFVIRIARAGGRAILDPFAGGRRLEAPELRAVVKRLAGAAHELDPAHLEAVSDREVLLRLLNNIRTRADRAGDLARVAEIGERMLSLAPKSALLQREQALVTARQGNLMRARQAAEAYLGLAENQAQARDAALLLQRLKAELH